MRAVNLLSTEVGLSGTPNNISNGILVRCVASVAGVVTRTTVGGTVVGSCTVLTTEPTYVFKDPSDTLTATGTVLASSITFMY